MPLDNFDRRHATMDIDIPGGVFVPLAVSLVPFIRAHVGLVAHGQPDGKDAVVPILAIQVILIVIAWRFELEIIALVMLLAVHLGVDLVVPMSIGPGERKGGGKKCQVSCRPRKEALRHLQLAAVLGGTLSREKAVQWRKKVQLVCQPSCFSFMQRSREVRFVWSIIVVVNNNKNTYPQHAVAFLFDDVLLSGRSEGKEGSEEEHENTLDGSHGDKVCLFWC
jgi:hypothetical protein